MKRYLKIIIIIAAILVVLFAIANILHYVDKKDNEEGNLFQQFVDDEVIKNVAETAFNASEDQRYKHIPTCEDNKELFTALPTDLSKVRQFVPLGNLNPQGGHVFPTDHMYFYPKFTSNNQTSAEVPVYAPGDVWITRISESTKEGNEPDYSIDFLPCRDVRAYYIHVLNLSDKLKEAINSAEQEDCWSETPGKDKYTNCNYEVNIKVSAGELLGTAGGSSASSHTFDIGVNDISLEPLPYANPERWQQRGSNVACPLDYFTPSVRETLTTKLKEIRSVEPVCGEVEQDEPGTAQGVWFQSSDTNDDQSRHQEKNHIALVHDNYDPTKAVFSIGYSLEEKGIPSDTYEFEPQASGLVNRDFKDITPGEVYCFNVDRNNVGSVIIEMPDATHLQIAQGPSKCGSGPWTLTNHGEFER